MSNNTSERGRKRSTVIPVIGERLRVGTTVRETGAVRVSKRVREQRVVVDEPVTCEDVHVERVPVDRFVDAPVPPRREGRVLVISVMAEVPVVVTRLKVVEEIRLVPRSRTVGTEQAVTIRTEEPVIERVAPSAEGRRGGQQWQRRS